ncbi:MAG: RDD family protein [Acidimicrobiia bacterium]
MSREKIRHERSREAQGKRAGFASQAVAMALDLVSVLAVYFALLLLFGGLRFVVTDSPFSMPQPGKGVNGALLLAVGWFVLAGAWSSSGRAPGMAVVGLRVVSPDGDLLRTGQSRLRAVLVVFTLGLGVVTVLFSRRNMSLYDMICKTAVVYAWRPGLAESRQNQ